MKNSEKFSKLFKEFEDETKKKLKYKYDKVGTCISILEEKHYNPYYNERSFIEFCRNLRNIDFHNNNDNYYMITDDTINKLEKIVEETKHPYKVFNKATTNIYYKTINDKVLETMAKMNEKSYTHIPIYDEDEKTLVGIFSENTVFQYIMNDKIIEINENTVFGDIMKCIDINNSKEIVKFVSREELYDDVVNDFIKEYEENNKLACVMVTQNGSKKDKIIGIITAWDIIGRR